jgi:ribosomal protein S18 acetylase RimI-like enzyme
MENRYSVRPVMLKDIDGIQRVAELSWRDTYRSIFPETFIDDFLKQAYSKENLELVIDRDIPKDKRRFILTEYQEQIVGFAQFSEINGGEIELLRIYIIPKFQGKGIGKSMLDELIQYDQALHIVFAWVEKVNHKGIGFYESNGFASGDEKVEEINGQKLRLKKYIKTIL